MRGRKKGGLPPAAASAPAAPETLNARAVGFLEYLAARAYTQGTIDSHRWAFTGFLEWAHAQGLSSPADFTRATILRFLAGSYEWQAILHFCSKLRMAGHSAFLQEATNGRPFCIFAGSYEWQAILHFCRKLRMAGHSAFLLEATSGRQQGMLDAVQNICHWLFHALRLHPSFGIGAGTLIPWLHFGSAETDGGS